MTVTSIYTQMFSCLIAVFVALGGFVSTVFTGVPVDSVARYIQRLSSVTIYENALETAIPQTDVARVVAEHFAGELPQGKSEKKAIIIGFDGGRADALDCLSSTGAVNYLMSNGAHAYIAYCGGVSYPQATIQKTSTAPGWCSILTGKWADVHGVTGNGVPKSRAVPMLLTSLVDDKVVDSSAFYTMWSGHFIDDNSTYKDEKAYCEEKGLNVRFSKSSTDIPVFARTLSDIKSSNCSDFIFTVLEGPDFTGHQYGFSPETPAYCLGYKLDDSMARLLIDSIEGRASYDSEDWLIILASDHGGYNTGHGGEELQARMTFIISNKEF